MSACDQRSNSKSRSFSRGAITVKSEYRLNNISPVYLQPTFPLQPRELRSLRDCLLHESPKLAIWQLLAQLGKHFSLLRPFAHSWKIKEREISEVVVEHAIKRSNARQDSEIEAVITELKRSQCRQYVEVLRRFLWLKRAIERSLQNNQSVAPQRTDIENLVDRILEFVCSEVVNRPRLEVRAASALTDANEDSSWLQRKIGESSQRIARAYETIEETKKLTRKRKWNEREKTEPHETEPDHVVFDRLLEQLRDENEISKAVNERVEAELAPMQ